MASFLTATLPTQTTNHPSFNILDDRHLRLASFDDSDGDSSTTTSPDRNPGSVEHIRALQETCINVAQDNHQSCPTRRSLSILRSCAFLGSHLR